MKLKWNNWQVYQELLGVAYQQVDRRLSNVILQCGFSWSPAMSPDLPILLTPLRDRPEIQPLLQLGFELEEAKVAEPTRENGFDYSGMLNSAWETFGVKR